MTTAIWQAGRWNKADIVRYSGKDVRLSLERQQDVLSSILAGTAHKRSGALAQLQQSQAAALELARHFASRGEFNGLAAEKTRVYRRNALGCYGVAQGLGATFDKFKASKTPAKHEATDTDRALVEAYSAETQGLLQQAAAMIDAAKGQRSLGEWASNLLEGRKARSARKAAKAAKQVRVGTGRALSQAAVAVTERQNAR